MHRVPTMELAWKLNWLEADGAVVSVSGNLGGHGQTKSIHSHLSHLSSTVGFGGSEFLLHVKIVHDASRQLSHQEFNALIALTQLLQFR